MGDVDKLFSEENIKLLKIYLKQNLKNRRRI